MGFTTGIGLKFRATAGYVSDTTDEQFIDGLDVYPKVYGAPGPAFVGGWDPNFVTTSDRDRSNLVDSRFAGMHFAASPVDTYYRTDLDYAVAHEMRCAIGDVGAGNNHRQTVRLYDNTTLISQPANNVETVGAVGNDSDFIDAAGTLHTTIPAWVSSNAAVNHTFTSTIAQIRLGVSTGGVNNTTTLAYFFLKQTGSPSSPPDQVTGLSASAYSPEKFKLSWNAPGDGGSPITGYKIEVSDDGVGWSVHTANTGNTNTTAYPGGYSPATLKYWRVSAINANGTGTASASASATTPDLADAEHLALMDFSDLFRAESTPPPYGAGTWSQEDLQHILQLPIDPLITEIQGTLLLRRLLHHYA